jgi:hypothetical protein
MVSPPLPFPSLIASLGSVEAVMDSLVKGKHIQTPYALDSKYSTEPHQIVSVLPLLFLLLFFPYPSFHLSL